MNEVDDLLAPYVAAWREESRTAPPPGSRERTRTALLAAVAATGHDARALPWHSRLRVRRGAPRLVGSLAALAATAAVGLAGWNAPAGSPLHGVRAARQSVQLAVPGANLAALHLQFAEQSLADARNRVNPAASLADARAELEAAHRDLPTDHGSPLWTRWDSDEATLGSEDAALGRGAGPAETGSSEASPGSTGSSGEGREGVTHAPAPAGAPGSAPPTERAEASPSASARESDRASPSAGATASPGQHDG